MNKDNNIDKHKLNNSWNLYYHLISNNNWEISSYVKIGNFNNLEEIIENYKYIDDDVCKKTMLFLMRENINPTWEDENNIRGACYSFKISNKIITNAWKNISYNLVSENLVNENELLINGISISPKKFFCILKIWISDKKFNKLKFNNDYLKNLEPIFKLNDENK
tara:strand:+ start:963 stop:1457 length:495 start_codon:yes stop_codon:yes gene_type:complete